MWDADSTHELISNVTCIFSPFLDSTAESNSLLQQLSAPDLSPDSAKSIVEQLAVLSGTNNEINSRELYGDGDQSLVTDGGERARQILRKLFMQGGDLGPHLINQGFSPFAIACGLGNPRTVENFIKGTKEGSKERTQLLERRETGLRLSPLLLTIALSKGKPYVCSITGAREADMNHVSVIKILLRNGARPDCKELAGKSAVHYGAGSHATSDTLKMTDYIVDAAKSCSYFGKRVVLRNLANHEYNGSRGYVGGYIAQTRRRQVILDDKEGNLSFQPKNIFSSCGEGEEVCIHDSSRNLLNDCDRCGTISLHEVFMSQRVDVAKFLTERNVSVDITPPCGNSVRKMVNLPTILGPSRMHNVIQSYIERIENNAD